MEELLQDDGQEAKFEIFVPFHIKLNWIFSSAKTNRIASLCIQPNKLYDVQNAMRSDAIVIGYAVHIHHKIDAICTVYNVFFILSFSLI